MSAVAARPICQPAIAAVSLRPSCSCCGSGAASSRFASEWRRPAIASPPRRGVNAVSAEPGPGIQAHLHAPFLSRRRRRGTARSCRVVASACSWKPPTATSEAARAPVPARAIKAPAAIAAPTAPTNRHHAVLPHPRADDRCLAIMHLRATKFKPNLYGPSGRVYHQMR